MTNYQTPNNIEIPSQPKPPMKWFKFLIYFGLFFGAFVNLSQGIQYINGDIYKLQAGVSFRIVYKACPTLEMVDIILGCLFILVAVLQIVSRFLLARYKDIGIKTLYATYVICILAVIFYAICGLSLFPIILNEYSTHSIYKEELTYNISNVLPVLIPQIVMLTLNVKYFSNHYRNILFN